jgi:hypothetical protein
LQFAPTVNVRGAALDQVVIPTANIKPKLADSDASACCVAVLAIDSLERSLTPVPALQLMVMSTNVLGQTRFAKLARLMDFQTLGQSDSVRT